VNPYVQLFAKSFKAQLAYRSQVWLQVLASIIAIWIQVAIWRALLGNGSASGIHLRDMVTYVVLNAVISAVLLTEMFEEADERIRTGKIAMDLLRPVSYPLYLLAGQLGKAAYRTVFQVGPTVALAALVFGLSWPASPLDAAAFVFAMAVAIAISFAFAYLIALLAFWFLTTLHFEWTFVGLNTLLSGAIVPLWFFPPGWAELARLLPFQFLGFVPAAIYMGKLGTAETWLTLAQGLGWAAALLIIAALLWTASIRRLVIQGG
jgi:ABC-2 type transport system permease protein